MTTELSTLSETEKGNVLEYVTPYKICVVVFLQQYRFLKASDYLEVQIIEPTEDKTDNSQKILVLTNRIEPIHKSGFCMLSLLLTQSPDMEFSELIEFIKNEKYNLHSKLLETFQKEIKKFLDEDVVCLIDTFSKIGKILQNKQNKLSQMDESCIYRNSKIGFYLRRIWLLYFKLSFDQIVDVAAALKKYLKKSEINITFTFNPESSKGDESAAMETTDLSTNISDVPVAVAQENRKKPLGGVGLWLKDQADIFICEQVRLLIEDSGKALPAHELQAKIKHLLSTNSDHTKAHYLSYINFLRVKELNGALASSHHYFDRSTFSDDDKQKGMRLAALNLGILYVLFNKIEEAVCSLNEAVTLSHEANDSVCLQYAQTWLYIINKDKKDILIQKSLAKCDEFNINYLLAFGYQAAAQYAASSRHSPASIFEMVVRSESLSCQHQLGDVVGASLVQRAALWSLYGYPDLAALHSQQLLHLTTPHAPLSNSALIALSSLILRFALRGEYEQGRLVVDFGKTLSGGEEWKMWSEGIVCFIESLHKSQWQRARIAVCQLSLVDPIEATLRECELMLAKGDRKFVCKKTLALIRSSETSITKVRALHLLAKANRQSSAIYLTLALDLANNNYLHYYKNLLLFDIVAQQIEVRMGQQAVGLAEMGLVHILAHGSHADLADCLFLSVKAHLVTSLDLPPSERIQLISSSIVQLDQAQDYARLIQDYARVKNIAYMQAVLCEMIGLTSDRNRYAFQFRSLNEQFPSYNASLDNY